MFSVRVTMSSLLNITPPGPSRVPWAGKHCTFVEYTNEWRELGQVRGYGLKCLQEPAQSCK